MNNPGDPHAVNTEHLLDCVWRVGLDLRIIDVSPAAEAMFGIPADALRGSPLADHTTPADLAGLRELVNNALAAGDRTAGLLHEIRVKHADGHLVPVEIRGRLLLDSGGQPVELLGVARDISNRRERERRDRQREQQRLEDQKLEALARLAAGIGTEFRALTGALLDHAGGDQSAALAPLLERAEQHLDQLDTLAGRIELQREDLDLDAHLTGLLDGLRTTLPAGVELVHRPGAGGSTVWADPVRLATAAMALVRNACEALPSGGTVTVTTGLRPADPEPDGPPTAPTPPWITIEVRDTGAGFDHATRERIFEPFFTTRGEREGLGLGLALVHGVVARHDGRLEVESLPGEGSAFRILLPARFADEVSATTAMGTDAVTRQTILLVDDDPDVRSYCERVLRSGGFDVISCADGVDALAVIAAGDPVDAVVLDWALPGLDGRRVREQIARRQPDLPLLVISGHASKDYEALGGIDRDTPWLAKPFTPPAFLEAVRRLLPSRAEAPGS